MNLYFNLHGRAVNAISNLLRSQNSFCVAGIVVASYWNNFLLLMTFCFLRIHLVSQCGGPIKLSFRQMAPTIFSHHKKLVNFLWVRRLFLLEKYVKSWIFIATKSRRGILGSVTCLFDLDKIDMKIDRCLLVKLNLCNVFVRGNLCLTVIINVGLYSMVLTDQSFGV